MYVVDPYEAEAHAMQGAASLSSAVAERNARAEEVHWIATGLFGF